MISQEEFSLLQQKYIQQNQEKERLAEQVKALELDNQNFASLKQKIVELKAEVDREEHVQMTELGNKTAEIRQIRDEIANAKTGQESKRNKKLEQQLEGMVEKLKKLDEQIIQLDRTDQENVILEEPLDKQLNDLTERLNKLKMYQEKLTNGKNIIVEITDLEGIRENLLKEVNQLKEEVPLLDYKLNTSENEKISKMSELRRITADIDAANDLVKNGDNEHSEKYKQLNKVSIELQGINDSLKSEKAKTIDIQKEYTKKIQDVTEQGNSIQKEIQEMNKKINHFPEYKKNTIDHLEMKVAKGKQLTEQLESKRNEIRQQIALKNQSSETVVNLTGVMEKEWVDHQRLLDDESRLKAQLDRCKEDLRRKRLASEEIERLFPKNAKPFKSAGMAELEHLYEVTLAQNKQLGQTLASLKDDYEIHKSDNQLLREFLEKQTN